MLPKAIEVNVLENYELLITFDNNEQRVFDVKPYLNFIQFESLKDYKQFKKVKIGDKVLYSKMQGESYNDGTNDYVLLAEHNVIAILEEDDNGDN